MSVYSTAIKRRSIRSFKQKKIPQEALKKFANAARLAPSAANLQPCEYIIIVEKLDEVFACTKWAGYVAPKGTPQKGRQPKAYIAILVNRKKVKFPQYCNHDAAAAAMSIMLCAEEKRIASCWIGSIDREKLKDVLRIPRFCEVNSLVALGYPAQESKSEKFDEDIRYWMDKKGNFHVPKRSLKEVVHYNQY